MTNRTLVTASGKYANEFGDPFVEGEAYFEITDYDSKYWYNAKGQFHRENGPAVEHFDGEKHWYFHGKYHRTDGPAAEFANGSKHWFFQGELHREGGPAAEYADGSKYWYIENKQYSEEEYEDALKIWKSSMFSKSVSFFRKHNLLGELLRQLSQLNLYDDSSANDAIRVMSDIAAEKGI